MTKTDASGRLDPMSEIKNYTKKPVTIEAIQIVDEESKKKAVAWIAENTSGLYASDDIQRRYMEGLPLPKDGVVINAKTEKMSIFTLEGRMDVSDGDFVIRGLVGEFYACKPDIFWDSYREARA